MIKIGVTGKNGFIGSHLINTINISESEFCLIDFDREFFKTPAKLDQFVRSCDVIVHLAAVNRDLCTENLMNTNIDLVQSLINSLKRTNSKPHVILSSSVQELSNNTYGKSKYLGRKMLAEWANTYGALFTGLIIPNVFGPFGKPYYNSVVSTFCSQLILNEPPIIINDSELNLIYVGELIDIILDKIRTKNNSHNCVVEGTSSLKVSELLERLKYFKSIYYDEGEIPFLNNNFDVNLFNTFRSYIDLATFFPKNILQHKDNRGSFTEVIRSNSPGQSSFSTTIPKVVRGNHFHTRKIERFCIVKGKAKIQLRRFGQDSVHEFILDGESPCYIDMPIWYTHNLTNIGDDELLTIFWINEPYDPKNPDTYYETV